MPDAKPSRRGLPTTGMLHPAGERPRCQRCHHELRPNFTYDLEPRGRRLTGYGLWDVGLFCSKACATRYAHQVVRGRVDPGQAQDSTSETPTQECP